MDRLSELACKWHTDKRPALPGAPGHGYTPYYHRTLMGKHVHRLLEIGIGSHAVMDPFVEDYIPAASLFMWQEYFPGTKIYALDIDPETFVATEEIYSGFVDVSQQLSLEQAASRLGGKFDLIIDDATHDPQDQIRAAKVFMPLLAKDGIYFIEDVGDASIADRILYHCDLVDIRSPEEISNWKYPSRLAVLTHGSRHG